MKNFSEDRPRISRPTAWAFLTANLAFPGVGSIGAGRWIGYVQLILALAGTVLTFVFGFRFISWYFANYDRLQANTDDPFAVLREVWIALRWAALGMAVFGFSWLWSLFSGFRILNKTEQPPLPPPPIAES